MSSSSANWFHSVSPKYSREWNREIFKRAFFEHNGQFANVSQRLRLGFSVLVYLPGNCMEAAAEVITQDKLKSDYSWIELGVPSNKELTVADIWRQSTSIFEPIKGWLDNASNRRPGIIFHNLNLLSDERGGLFASNEAKTALLYMIKSVRTGVVLGLSDRDAGELPKAIRQIFDEEIWLDEILEEQFLTLIPALLGERLTTTNNPTSDLSAVTDAIATRLRWTDPIRAVTIMQSVAEKVKSGDVNGVLTGIMRSTRTVEFLNPEQIADLDTDPTTGEPTGFEHETIQLLKSSIIQPYQYWQGIHRHQPLERLPPGLVLYGPPGTGKTRLARWIAKSIGLPVRLVSAADLRRADYGESERLVKALFRSARRSAPCVIVLDDADDLLRNRNKIEGSLASAERGIVNAFLQELEGWEGRAAGVLVILTTNQRDALDPAIKTRLHLHIRIPYPLDENQVTKVVDSVAKAYDLILEPAIHRDLIEYFMGTQKGSSKFTNTTDPQTRRNLENNLFSPREIASAMRILIEPTSKSPSPTAFKRMKKYIEQYNAESLVDK